MLPDFRYIGHANANPVTVRGRLFPPETLVLCTEHHDPVIKDGEPATHSYFHAAYNPGNWNMIEGERIVNDAGKGPYPTIEFPITMDILVTGQARYDRCATGLKVTMGPLLEFCERCGCEKCYCEKCWTQWCLDHQPNPLVCPKCGANP